MFYEMMDSSMTFIFMAFVSLYITFIRRSNSSDEVLVEVDLAYSVHCLKQFIL